VAKRNLDGIAGDDDLARVGGGGGGVRVVTTCKSCGTQQNAHHQDCVSHRHSSTGMGMRVRGHTCTRTAALAVEEGPPSPVLRPGPIQGMGRAVRCQAHALTGLASARRNAEDENSSTIARTFFRRPVQADETESACDTDHDDMRIVSQRNRKVERAHLPGLMEKFERALRPRQPPPPPRQRRPRRDWPLLTVRAWPRHSPPAHGEGLRDHLARHWLQDLPSPRRPSPRWTPRAAREVRPRCDRPYHRLR
jgi:hypothetical protein